MKFDNLIYRFAAFACGMILFASCDEDSNIGSSLVDIDSSIVIADDFHVTGKSKEIGSVQSRTIMQLIGNIDAEGYGKFNSDFVTQFMPAAAIDTTLTESSQIDGIRMVMMHYAGEFVGDSVVPMGLEVFRLDKSLQAPIYSNLNPEGYYNPSAPLASKAYTSANSELVDSLASLNYREIYVDLPKSLGVELFEMYVNNPQSYVDPAIFCEQFKGLYVKSSFGSGRVTKIGATVLQLLYHQDTVNSAGRDTTLNYEGNFYAVSPEIITNNNIAYEMSTDLLDRIENGEALVVAPAGEEVELQFPINDIMSYYRLNSGKLSVINDLTFSIPASKITNDYGINPPSYLLMVLSDQKEEFFRKSDVTDNVTSFYAKYDDTTGYYDFGSMRAYLLDMLSKADVKESDYTFTVTPVSVSTETVGSSYYGNLATYVTNIAPYVEQPAMARLELDKAKIIFTFSNQNLKN